ncbi:MAG: DNA repair protein RecN [Nitrospinae bacterium]|nr:DNA repair protein RecN [Nitrospinota bacterium]
MIKELTIENLGIISKIQVSFSKGLNILTGETGVGKSMVLSAVNLLGGAKANDSLIKSGEEKLVVSALFDFSEYPELLTALEKEEIDLDGKNVEVRRIVNVNGKNRVFINDIPVKLTVLKLLAQTWFDIHGQNDSHSLNDNLEQLSYLDAFGGLLNDKEQYQHCFSEYQHAVSKLKKLEEEESKLIQEVELLRFQLTELDTASLQHDEDTLLDEEYKALTHVEQIKLACYTTKNNFEEAEDSALSKINEAKRELANAARFDNRLQKLLEEIDSITLQMNDVVGECSAIFENAEYDKERLNEIEERIALIQKLKTKYSLDVNGILNFQEEIREKIDGFQQQGEEKEKLKKKINELFLTLSNAGIELAKKRELKSTDFEKEIMQEIAGLNMDKALFKIAFIYDELEKGIDYKEQKCSFDENGIGSIRFDISTNPGEPLKPLNEVVSGGELSRLMLAVKSMLSKKDDLPVLIFDEIDTGIGGKTAHRIGEKLKKIAESRQVITISHLPQIAVHAETHFRIEKTYSENKTLTSIITLNNEEKVAELKRMLGDESGSDSSTQFVLEMLKKQ